MTKRACSMIVIDGVFCLGRIHVMNRRKTRFNRHAWIECTEITDGCDAADNSIHNEMVARKKKKKKQHKHN